MKTVVLDIGGVLVKLGGMDTLLRWTGLGPAELKSRWLRSEVVTDFETGRLSFDTFAPKVIEEFSLPVNEDQLASEMCAWMSEGYAGAGELVATLRGQHKLACMCNLNELQWPQVQRALNVDASFPNRFVSFQVGMVKPNPEFFALVGQAMNADPNDIHFFDDSRENVEGALRCGWNAKQVQGIEALRAALNHDGLL